MNDGLKRIRCGLTFVLALVAASLSWPAHGCHLNSPVLMLGILLVCFGLLPLLAYRTKSTKGGIVCIVTAPVLTILALTAYVEAIHWARFPPWLLGPGRDSARIVAAQTQLVAFGEALGRYHEDCDRYPSTAEGLKVLIEQPETDAGSNWSGPYLSGTSLPPDPWGHGYMYRYSGGQNTIAFHLFSTGPDGASKTDGHDDDDLNYWEVLGKISK